MSLVKFHQTWSEIAFQLKKEEQEKSLRLMAEVSNPSTRSNWVVQGDDEDFFTEGNLDYVLRAAGVREHELKRFKRACLFKGCIWIVPGPRPIFFSSVIKANSFLERANCNFLTVKYFDGPGSLKVIDVLDSSFLVS